MEPFSSPEPTILLVCAKDRDLWQGPKQEVRESRTSGFCAQPQKFETITVTIGYKNGQLLRLRVAWTLPEVSILGADQKDRGLWGRECSGTESDSSSSDSDIDDFRTGSRHGKRSKYVREVENKKTKFSRSKTRKTYRRKSGRKDRHASKGDEKNEPVYTALVRKDSSDSFIPFMFLLKSVNAFDLFKTKVLNACSTSRTNAQLYYNHSECKVTLNSATWESFVVFLKSRQDCTVTLQVKTVSSAASAALRTRGLFSSQLPGPSTVSNAPQQNVKNVLDMIIEKDWSGVFIQGLPKKSSEDAMRELIRRNLKETWCKTCSVSHSTKAVVAPCPEGQQLAGQVRKLLTSCELRRFFDKRAAVRKVFGSADLLLNPLCVQCPICAAVVALGHLNDIMIKNDHFWKHIKSSHVDNPVTSRFRGKYIYSSLCMIQL